MQLFLCYWFKKKKAFLKTKQRASKQAKAQNKTALRMKSEIKTNKST